MKLTKTLLLLLIFNFSLAQKTETIKIPKGIVYNYCDNKTIEKAKKLINDNLSSESDYKLLQDNLIIGPVLWESLKDNINIQKIEKGKVQFHVDNQILDGKMSQDINDSKIIWDEFKKIVSKDYIIRKANEEELKYYWSVISFDIDEPLLIIETKEHNFILNFLKKDLKLMWLDEAPKSKKGDVKYQNGKETNTISKGIKETKLEQVLLLNTDEELKESSSIEDLTAIVEKTNLIFNDLFINSKESGKIMVEFELKKDTNEIEFAIRDEIDLEIMKEFEKRVIAEKYPTSKKNPIKIQLIYKVNSYNDTE